MSSIGKLTLGVLFVSLFITLFSASTVPKKQAPTITQKTNPLWLNCSNPNHRWKVEAFVEKLLKDRLKSPSSAKISNFKLEQSNENPKICRAVGVVDSQNSYGAILRKNFIITVEFDPIQDNWIARTGSVSIF